MKILVIKQTSLGDVLHSTGHVRSIKKQWPNSELVLLTANGSADIYRNSPWVDRMILVDRARVKSTWCKQPRWAWQHMRDVMRQVRFEEFDIAFDLQGLAKSVCFLYGAKAKRKYVKGRWPFLRGFKNPYLHALEEMDQVLKLAEVSTEDTSMEFATSKKNVEQVNVLLSKINPKRLPLVIFSPFSRWHSKDWPLQHYIGVAEGLADRFQVVFTGAPDKEDVIDAALRAHPNLAVVNLAGKIDLTTFAELVRRAGLVLTGDSFPMHVAAAVNSPLLALFGPTDPERVGPKSVGSEIIRAPDCRMCYRRNCKEQCLSRVTVDEVLSKLIEKSSTLDI